MTIQTLPLSSIQPSNINPRTAIDSPGIESLAASILTDGVLQNLVVMPFGRGKKRKHRIVSGERRYRALQLLLEQGHVTGDYPVPVDIRPDLSGEDTIRIATVENVQRENLSPLDEAAAITRLLQDGETAIEDITAQTGLSASTIKRRVALVNLCEEVKDALASGTVTLAQAEAFTLGTHNAQRAMIKRGDFDYLDAADIREHFLESKPSVSMARFPVDQYQGTFTRDLFAEDDATYFDDEEQFFTLQRQAVSALAEQYGETAAWVDVFEEYYFPRHHYKEAGDGESGGVVIHFCPSGEVEIIEGLVKRDLDASTARATAKNPLAQKPKPAYSEVLCRYIAHHKSMAVQHLLLANPRKAKEVAILLLLGASDYVPSVRVSNHGCLNAFAQTDAPPASYQGVEQQARHLAEALGLVDGEEESTGWRLLCCVHRDVTALYEALKSLSEEDIDKLHLLLTVLAFGQGDCSRIDTGATLFNRVARDLGVDMRAYWRPDADFLSRRTKPQLLQITEKIGLNKEGPLAKLKKSELVTMLGNRFERVHDISNPADNDHPVRDWLPDAMGFDAVDPAEPEDVEEETGEVALAA